MLYPRYWRHWATPHHAQGRTLPSMANRTQASSTLSPTHSRWPWLAGGAAGVAAEVAREGLRFRRASALSLASWGPEGGKCIAAGPPDAVWSWWSIAGIYLQVWELFICSASLGSFRLLGN